MLAEMIPFPVDRRRRFVARQAARMADLSTDAAERHLQHQLQVQADAMARKGISSASIAEQQARLKRAIRNELWHLVLCPGDEV